MIEKLESALQEKTRELALIISSNNDLNRIVLEQEQKIKSMNQTIIDKDEEIKRISQFHQKSIKPYEDEIANLHNIVNTSNIRYFDLEFFDATLTTDQELLQKNQNVSQYFNEKKVVQEL